MSADPSGFVSNPPSTVVKVVNTARDDMNGQLGIALGYQADRGRYLVLNVVTQQTMALKPENLVKASMMESAKAQYQQLRNDPRIKQQVSHYYDLAKRRLHPVKPEHAAAGVLVVWLGLVYTVGFTKMLMLTSLILMLGVMVAPDIMEGASFRTMLNNVPRRSREAMEESMPFLKGRLTNRIALGILILMVGLAGKSLFTGTTKAKTPPTSPATAAVPHSSKAFQEQYYKLGFDDATSGLEFGASLKETTGAPETRSLNQDESFDYDYVPPRKGPSFGFGSAMSAFYILKTVKELGTDAGGGGFSPQLLVANLRTLDAMSMGLLGFSLYNIIKSFV